MKRRESQYPVRLAVNVDTRLAARLEDASERYGIARGVIMRRAIEHGLRAALDGLRKQARDMGGGERDTP